MFSSTIAKDSYEAIRDDLTGYFDLCSEESVVDFCKAKQFIKSLKAIKKNNLKEGLTDFINNFELQNFGKSRKEDEFVMMVAEARMFNISGQKYSAEQSEMLKIRLQNFLVNLPQEALQKEIQELTAELQDCFIQEKAEKLANTSQNLMQLMAKGDPLTPMQAFFYASRQHLVATPVVVPPTADLPEEQKEESTTPRMGSR